jgi:hypothetical protein
MSKDKPIGKCVYCGSDELSDEHYLPECLGRFKDFESLKDGICKACNEKCSKLEDQLCRNGEIGFMRNALGIVGKHKKHKKPVDPFDRGSAGVGPLKMTGKIPGEEQEVRLRLVRGSLTGIEYMPQLIVTTPSGETHFIIIPSDMTEPDQLSARLKDLGIEGELQQARVIMPDADRERMQKLLSKWKIKHQVWSDLPITGQILTKTNVEVSDKYFRAIAKIGFHYALKYLHLRGDEDFFADIRTFIMDGGDISRFVVWSQQQFIEQVKAGLVPETYCHIVSAEANYDVITSRLQFFLGPENVPYVYTVRLGRNTTPLHYRVTRGHQFCLYPDGPREGKDGVMEQLTLISKTLLPY